MTYTITISEIRSRKSPLKLDDAEEEEAADIPDAIDAIDAIGDDDDDAIGDDDDAGMEEGIMERVVIDLKKKGCARFFFFHSDLSLFHPWGPFFLYYLLLCAKRSAKKKRRKKKHHK